jgi:hypothetical protein
MKRSFKISLALSVFLVMLVSIGLEVAYAQKYVKFSGAVVSVHKKSLSVKDSKGVTMNFVMGRKTQFDPGRLPNVGEKVEVDYYLKRSSNVAYQVRIKTAQ